MTPDVAPRAPLTAAEEQRNFQVGACWSREAHLASGGAHPTSPGRGQSSAKPREVTRESWLLWARGPRRGPGSAVPPPS